MSPIGELVTHKDLPYVVSDTHGSRRTLIGPVYPRSAYTNVIQQELSPATRENPSGGWSTLCSADFIDPTPDEQRLLDKGREALVAS